MSQLAQLIKTAKAAKKSPAAALTFVQEAIRAWPGTQRKLAAEVGVSHMTITRIMRGEPVARETARKVGRALSVPVKYFRLQEEK